MRHITRQSTLRGLAVLSSVMAIAPGLVAASVHTRRIGPPPRKHDEPDRNLQHAMHDRAKRRDARKQKRR